MSRSGKTFEETKVGQSFSGQLTVTESHIVLAAGIFGDFAPLHVDEEFARQTRFGTRIAHGPLIAGIAAGVLSTYFHGTAIGYLEQNVRFIAPVMPGDTVRSEWQIQDKALKEKLGGGLVTLDVESRKIDGDVVMAGTAKVIVKSSALPR